MKRKVQNMDYFKEEIIVKKNRGLDEFLYYFSLVMMIVMGLVAMMLLQFIFISFSIPTLVLLLISAGGAVLMFFRRDRLRTDFEYTFTNGEMDFAQVFNNKKRKNLGSMRVKNVEAFGPVSGQAFQRYVSMPNVKKDNWFLNRGAELYYFYFTKDGQKRMIIIEPSEEMVDMIKQFVPRHVYQG